MEQTATRARPTKPEWNPTITPVPNHPGYYTCTSRRYPQLAPYLVDLNSQTCSCPAIVSYGKEVCRHIRAVADYVEQRNEEALRGLRDREAEERLQALVREHGGAANLLTYLGVDYGGWSHGAL